MRRLVVSVFLLPFLFYATAAFADRYEDCKQSDDSDRRVRGCTEIIERGGQETSERRSAAHVLRGWAYANKGDLAHAIADSTDAIGINPGNFEAFNLRGVAHKRNGDHDRALADYTKAIEIKPDFAGAYFNRGLAYLDMGEFDRAIDDYTKAIELDPENPDYYNSRAAAYERKGQPDRAGADYTKANVNLCESYDPTYDDEVIIGACTRAIEADPKNIEAYYSRAFVAGMKGDLDLEIDDYTKIIEIEPEDTFA
jgi:tetratricopeptide (TPR) repeat protein